MPVKKWKLNFVYVNLVHTATQFPNNAVFTVLCHVNLIEVCKSDSPELCFQLLLSKIEFPFVKCVTENMLRDITHWNQCL